MASDTDTARPDPGRLSSWFSWLPGSRLGRLIIVLNLLGLTILISGALVLNELRRGLVNARIDSLTTQGELIVNVINRAATVGEPKPELDPQAASEILQMLSNPRSQRARLSARRSSRAPWRWPRAEAAPPTRPPTRRAAPSRWISPPS